MGTRDSEGSVVSLLHIADSNDRSSCHICMPLFSNYMELLKHYHTTLLLCLMMWQFRGSKCLRFYVVGFVFTWPLIGC